MTHCHTHIKDKKKILFLTLFAENSVTECRNKAIHASLDVQNNVYDYSLSTRS